MLVDDVPNDDVVRSRCVVVVPIDVVVLVPYDEGGYAGEDDEDDDDDELPMVVVQLDP